MKGSIQYREHRPSTWRARYWAPWGREVSKSFRRKSDAETWLQFQAGGHSDERFSISELIELTDEQIITLSQARPLAVPVPIPRKETIRRAGRSCTYCGRRGGAEKGPDGTTWHVNHIVPTSKGGTNHPSNLALACAPCNLAKGASTDWIFSARGSQ